MLVSFPTSTSQGTTVCTVCTVCSHFQDFLYIASKLYFRKNYAHYAHYAHQFGKAGGT